MKVQLKLKYSIGDEVKFNSSINHFHYGYRTYWSGEIPEEDNHWKIDGYAAFVEKDGIKVKYCFHAYCSKYFDYHELIDEDKLEAISEAHPQEFEWEIKDLFGNPIGFNETLYYGLYKPSVVKDKVYLDNYLHFVKRGYPTKFIKSENISGYSGDSVVLEHLDDEFTRAESLKLIISKIPDTFVDDMASLLLTKYINDSASAMDKFKEISGWFGLTDECLAKGKELKKLKESGKTVKKKTVKKKAANKDEFDAEKILKGLSKKQKEQLLKELTKN